MSKPANFVLTAWLADVHQEKVYPVTLTVVAGRVHSLVPADPAAIDHDGYLMPGLVDAHIHIESSLLVPSEFARLAVVHGSLGTVSDPHEIANVCGKEGIDFMLENAAGVDFCFCFGVPSCVPATVFETAGAALDAAAVTTLLEDPRLGYLSEMMNFPGVLQQDPEVMAKIAAAQKTGKPIDGHAPGLRGAAVAQYIAAGISTDHECFTLEEAQEKISLGMKILIREGSAAKNFEALWPLVESHPQQVMFCSDDKHPDGLLLGHINQICARAVAKGLPLFAVLRAATVNPIEHYRMPLGLLRPGDPADFILVKDLESFEVLATYKQGKLLAAKGQSLLPSTHCTPVNRFLPQQFHPHDFALPVSDYPCEGDKIPVISAIDGQLITPALWLPGLKTMGQDGQATWAPNPQNDLLKIVVVNRYQKAPIACAFVQNFGLRHGAIASSVAHDSHNVVAVGASDAEICRAVNAVMAAQGGLSCALPNGDTPVLPLPVAGLMSAADGYAVAEQYTALDQAAKSLGTGLSAPFMTLSFMALLVIPHLKLSDKGLFDGDRFCFLSAPVPTEKP